MRTILLILSVCFAINCSGKFYKWKNLDIIQSIDNNQYKSFDNYLFFQLGYDDNNKLWNCDYLFDFKPALVKFDSVLKKYYLYPYFTKQIPPFSCSPKMEMQISEDSTFIILICSDVKVKFEKMGSESYSDNSALSVYAPLILEGVYKSIHSDSTLKITSKEGQIIIFSSTFIHKLLITKQKDIEFYIFFKKENETYLYYRSNEGIFLIDSKNRYKKSND